jgi:hypothetical protein
VDRIVAPVFAEDAAFQYQRAGAHLYCAHANRNDPAACARQVDTVRDIAARFSQDPRFADLLQWLPSDGRPTPRPPFIVAPAASSTVSPQVASGAGSAATHAPRA